MAKEIYEALNEQLTTELPQLIDLRVPYLDPSFEALVKIQLRCKTTIDLQPHVQRDWRIDSSCVQQFVQRHIQEWPRYVILGSFLTIGSRDADIGVRFFSGATIS